MNIDLWFLPTGGGGGGGVCNHLNCQDQLFTKKLTYMSQINSFLAT